MYLVGASQDDIRCFRRYQLSYNIHPMDIISLKHDGVSAAEAMCNVDMLADNLLARAQHSS
jgi:hypothetical protein